MAKGTDKLLRQIIGNDDVQELVDKLETSQKAIMKAATSSGMGTSDIDRLSKRLLSTQKEIHKAVMKGDAERVDTLVKRMGDARVDLLTPATIKKLGGQLTEVAGSFGDTLSDTLSGVISKDMTTISKFLYAAGEKAKKVGAVAETNTMAGKKGDVVASIGKLTSALGPVILGIGAVAAGFAFLAKVVIDADSATKELNRELLGSGIAISDFTSNAYEVTNATDKMTKSFINTKEAMAFNMEWGTKAKDSLAVLNSIAAAGVPVTAMVGDLDQAAQRLRGITGSIFTYATLLGETNDKISSDFGAMYDELGGSLESIRDHFADIAEAAKNSGFGVKRFYGMVLQITSGMAMYNVRLNETMELLTKMGAILGAKGGEELVKSQLGGFRGQDTESRTVTTLKAGTKNISKLAKQEAESAARVLSKTFTDILLDESSPDAIRRGDNLNKIMGDYGLRGSPEEMAAKMSKMSQSQMQEISAQLTTVQKALGGKFGDLWKTSQGIGGGLGGTQLALTGFGAAGTMLAKMRALESIPGFSGKTVADINYKDIPKSIALEKLGGMSEEELQAMKEVAGQVRGFQSAFKSGRVSPELMKMFNVEQGSDGKLKSSITGKDVSIDDFDSLFRSMIETKEKDQIDKEGQLTRDQQWAKATADNTRDILDKFDTVVESLLSSINDTTKMILNLVGGSDEGKSNKKQASKRISAIIDSLNEDIREEQDPEEKRNLKGRVDHWRRRLNEIAKTGDEAAESDASWYNSEKKTKQLREDKIKELMYGKEGRKKESKDDKRAEKQSKSIVDGVVEGIHKNEQKRKIDQIIASLITDGMGYEAAYDAAHAVIEKTSYKNKEDYDKALIKAGKVNDGLLTMESGGERKMYRVDSKDSLAIWKPGGPLSKQQGGNNSITVNVMQWGDVPQVVETYLRTLKIA